MAQQEADTRTPERLIDVMYICATTYASPVIAANQEGDCM